MLKTFSLLSLLALSVVGFTQITTITNGLIAEYTFNDGTANADFGTINGVTSNTSLTYDRYGCPGRALYFDMTQESLMSLGDNFDNDFAGADQEWSISCWFQLDSIGNPYAPMWNKYSHNGCGVDHREYILRMTANNEVEFAFNSGPMWTNFVIVRSPLQIVDREWHHVVINYDGSQDGNGGLDRVTMWIDNVLQSPTIAASGGGLADITDGDAHFGIGARLDENGDYCPISGQDHLWDGGLDDYRLYNRLLTPAEVDSLFNEPAPACVSGIESIEEVSFASLYPNPSDDFITVQLDKEFAAASYEIKIVDLQGKLVYFQIATSNKTSIDVSGLRSSTYIVYIIEETRGEFEAIRFVKH